MADLGLHWEDGSVGTVSTGQARGPEFDPQYSNQKPGMVLYL